MSGFGAVVLRWTAAAIGLVGTFEFVFLGFGAAIILWSIAGVCGAGARKLQAALDRAAIQVRSADAEQTRVALASKCFTAPYFLYLRPFFSDDLLINNPRKGMLPFLPSFYYPKRVHWETVFSDVVHETGRMIALGTPADSPGAGKVTVRDERWMDTFVMLATFADAVFIWPSMRPGTRWEIEWLSDNGLLKKCIFCIPEEYDRWVDRQDENWLSVRAFLLARGFDVPQEQGVAFTVDPPRVMTLRTGSRRRTTRALGAFLIPLRNTQAHEVRRSWEAYEAAIKELPHRQLASTNSDGPMRLTCVERGHLLPPGEIVCPICERLS